MNTYYQGDPVTLTDTLTVAGVATDPSGLTLEIADPAGKVTVVAKSGLTRVSTGVYSYSFDTTAGLPGIWTYQFVSTGTAQGSEANRWLLQALPIGSAPNQSAPRTSVCSPWATPADITEADISGFTAAQNSILANCLQAASDVLYTLSGSRWAGSCADTVRPQPRIINRDHGRPLAAVSAWWSGNGWGYYTGGYMSGYGYSRWGWVTTNQEELPDGSTIPSIDLGVYPLTGITQILIDGQVVDASTYRVDDNRHLVRVINPAENPGGNNAGWPCFPAGTFVLTDQGQKPIEAIKEGDRVLTHRNRWRTVMRAGKTGESETVTITGRGGKVRCTPDHQFWAAEVGQREIIGRYPRGTFPNNPTKSFNRYGRHKLGPPSWMEAQHLVGNAWAIPARIDPLPIPLPEGWLPADLPANFWWVIGRWLGDGWTAGGRAKPPVEVLNECPECGWKPRGMGGVAVHRGKMHRSQPRKRFSNAGVLICCGHHETEEMERELAGTGWAWKVHQQTSVTRFRYSEAALWAWLRDQFGIGASGKTIPAWMLGAPEETRRQFLAGYVSADGSHSEPAGRRRSTSVSTVSRHLMASLKMLVASLGYAPSGPYETPGKPYVVIAGRKAKTLPAYRLDWTDTGPDGSRSQAWTDGDHLWGRVRSVVLDETVVPVYDLEVQDDHSFIAEGFVVHNCQQRDDLPSSEKGTWEVAFTYGIPPPPGGVLACAELGYQLYLASSPTTAGQCRLPQRIQSITRQGMTAIVIDPMKFLDQGRTGLLRCDLWLASVNPGGLRRRATIQSPDIQRRVRRTGPVG